METQSKITASEECEKVADFSSVSQKECCGHISIIIYCSDICAIQLQSLCGFYRITVMVLEEILRALTEKENYRNLLAMILTHNLCQIKYTKIIIRRQ
jgi:hypothetical protein